MFLSNNPIIKHLFGKLFCKCNVVNYYIRDDDSEFNDEVNGYEDIEMKPNINNTKICDDTEENPLENKYNR